jgi:trigger factor
MCRKAYGFKSRLPHKPFTKEETKLKLDTELLDNHQLSVTAELEPERMEKAKRSAARKIASQVKISGFRPGKAPYDIVRRQIGDGRITEEAVEILVDEVYPEILKEGEIKPGAPGVLEKVESIDPPKFKFIIPLEPDVSLGDYRAIRLPYDWKEPGESDVENAIEELRRMYGTTQTVDRPAEVGDFVLIDLRSYPAKSSEGEPPIDEFTSYPIFIRPDEKEDEFQFNGFSKELIGVKPGESKSLSHKFAKDHPNEKMRGLNAKYDISVKTVRGVILPELNDEFAKQVGPFENVQALHDTVKANITSRSKADYDNNYFLQLVDKIKEGATVKYPPQVLDHELEHVIEDISARLAEQNMDLETYLKSKQMDREKFIEEEAKPVALRRLERSLILDKVAEVEKVEVKEQAFNTAFQQTYGEMQSSIGERKAIPKRVVDAVAMESVIRAKTNETLQRLKELANGQGVDSRAEKTEPSVKKAAKPKKASDSSRQKKTQASGSDEPSIKKAKSSSKKTS